MKNNIIQKDVAKENGTHEKNGVNLKQVRNCAEKQLAGIADKLCSRVTVAVTSRDWSVEISVSRDVQRHLPTMAESLRFLGSLPGHKGWVTAIATSSENPDMILTASRGIYLLHNPHSHSFNSPYRTQTRPSSSGN